MTFRRSFNPLVAGIFVLWFGSYAYLYLFAFTGFKPLYSYFLLFGYFAFWLVTTRKLACLGDWGVQSLILWLSLFLAYGCLTFLHSSQDAVAAQRLITLGEAVLFTGALLLLFTERRTLRRVQTILVVVAVLATILNGYDFLYSAFTAVPGRAAGLYVNPNISGMFIAMAMVAGVPAAPRGVRLWFALLCGVGILLTFSRAAWILWGLGVLWLGWMGEIGLTRRRWLAVALTGCVGLGLVGLLFTGVLGSALNQGIFGAHLDPNTLARLGIGSSSLSGFAANEREMLIGASLRIGAESPLLGHGLGYTDEWRFPVGPHNMYLLFWVEGGVLGVLLYFGLMVLLWKNSRGTGRVVALQLIVAGMFTHNQLQQPAFLMLTSFVVAHYAVAHQRRRVEALAVLWSRPA